MSSIRRLDRAFYARPCLDVARALVGAYLVRHAGGRRMVGRVVETEAYCGPDDLASHARRGPTPRARIMFGPPGLAYVYLVYGFHHCLNVVCDRDGFPAAILIRAIEPVVGVEARTDGPGKLCAALSITRADNGADLVEGDDLFLEEHASQPAPRLVATPRIGVDYAGEEWAAKPWRFVDAASKHLSRRLPTDGERAAKGATAAAAGRRRPARRR